MQKNKTTNQSENKNKYKHLEQVKVQDFKVNT